MSLNVLGHLDSDGKHLCDDLIQRRAHDPLIIISPFFYLHQVTKKEPNDTTNANVLIIIEI
jgi:hypothetical protein